MKFRVEIEEDDIIILNSKRWRVINIDEGEEEMEMNPIAGHSRKFGKVTLEEMMRYSGEIQIIKEDYQQIE